MGIKIKFYAQTIYRMKKLKILLLTDRLSLGGAETHILSLCRALTSRGHTVVVASSGGELSENVPHVKLDLSAPSPRRLIRGYFRLRSLILREKFDLVHAHARLPALVASLALRGSDVPLVSTAHARFKADPLRRALSTWGFRSVAVSEDLRFYLTRTYGISPENIAVVENGVDFKAAKALSPFSPKEKFTILFLSRLDADCSLCAELLVSLAPRLLQKYPNAEIVIGGGGERFEDIKRRAEDVNRAIGADAVRAVGALTDVSAFFTDGSLFVGVSRSAIEALSFGLPVIVAGNEGFLGRLREENFSLALSTNFCARGEPLPTEERLFEEIAFAIENYSAVLDDSRRVYAKAREKLDISRVVLRYENFYYDSLREYKRAKAKGAKTLLFGYYGYSNLGDNALLRAAALRAEREFGAPIAAFTHKPKKASREFGIRAYSRSSPFSLIWKISRCDRLIFGGGTLFQDRTSKRSLTFYIAVLRFAQLLKKETLLYANGIGEIKSPALRALLLKALRRCSYVGLRDNLSLNILKKEGFDVSSVTLEKDIALTLSPSSRERAEFLARYSLGERSDRFFAVCPHGGASRFERFELDIAIRAQKNKKLTPLFIACSPEDERLCLLLKRKYGGASLAKLSFSDILALFPLSSCVISTRYHPLLAARAQNVPYVSVGSDGKLKEFES